MADTVFLFQNGGCLILKLSAMVCQKQKDKAESKKNVYITVEAAGVGQFTE